MRERSDFLGAWGAGGEGEDVACLGGAGGRGVALASPPDNNASIPDCDKLMLVLAVSAPSARIPSGGVPCLSTPAIVDLESAGASRPGKRVWMLETGYLSKRRTTRQALCPPNPKELLRAMRIFRSRAVLGQ